MRDYMLNAEVAVMLAAQRARQAVKNFMTDEKGDTNFISVIIILCVVCALAVVFRKNIASIVNGIWTKVFSDAGTASGGNVGSATTFN